MLGCILLWACHKKAVGCRNYFLGGFGKFIWQADHLDPFGTLRFSLYQSGISRVCKICCNQATITPASYWDHIGICQAYSGTTGCLILLVVMIFQLCDVSFRRLRFVPNGMSSETGSHLWWSKDRFTIGGWKLLLSKRAYISLCWGLFISCLFPKSASRFKGLLCRIHLQRSICLLRF